MLVSTKGRYALRVMVDLAEHTNLKQVPLKAIAARQDISEKYLESIVKSLVQAGFLIGIRGKGGGYRLSRAPHTYTVRSILQLTETSLAPVSCLTENTPLCNRSTNCRTLRLWIELEALVADFFEKYTLADLVARAQPGNDFVI